MPIAQLSAATRPRQPAPEPPQWLDYGELHAAHSVTGQVRVWPQLYSPQLDNYRDINVYLPPSYARNAGDRYPVLFMHDGQNLFDEATSYAGDWGVDETMQRLAQEDGLECLVVAIPNMAADRLDEYSPFRQARLGGGRGRQYLEFIAETVKPLIDRSFRTRLEPAATGIMGSSMGGLISLYAFFRRPDLFGFAGVMSPALWFGHGAIYDYVEQAPFRPGKVYLDAGTREHGGEWPRHLLSLVKSRRYTASVRRMQRLLARKGYRPVRDLLYIEDKGGQHHESAWRRRLPRALRFFLAAAATSTAAPPGASDR